MKISGTGIGLPKKRVSNILLEGMCCTDAEWVEKTLGIKERRIATTYQTTSTFASIAALQAIKNARLTPRDIDMIIVATATPDRKAPSTACIVQRNIKAKRAVCFDIAAVCSGFLYGMVVANQFISQGTYKHVLVIGADTFSSVTDYSRRDCVFFGDGAGAAVFSQTDEGFFAFELHSDGEGWDGFTIPGGGVEIPPTAQNMDEYLKTHRYFEMDGKKVYETATTVLPQTITSLLANHKIDIDRIAMLIPHQPSIGILKETARKIGLPFEKVRHNMAKYANTSAGTIPILLHEQFESINKGDLVLFAAVGSGWTWGSAIIEWV